MTWALMIRIAPNPSGEASVVMVTLALSLVDRVIFLVGLSFVTLRYSMRACLAPSSLFTTNRCSLLRLSVLVCLRASSSPPLTSASRCARTA